MRNSIEQVLKVIGGVKGSFVLGIIGNLYLLIAIPAMTITYIVFEKLQKAGVFELISNHFKRNMAIIEKLATECTEKILDLSQFISCFNNS